MKKLIYIATVNIDIQNPDGVAKKILNQVYILQKYYDVDLIFFNEKNIFKMNNKKSDVLLECKSRANKFKVYRALKLLNFNNYDFAYIRYPKSDFYLVHILKRMQSSKMKILMEIPTYPYNFEGNESFKGKIINLLDLFYREKLKKYVDRIITYSNDNIIFGIETIKTINGINFSSEKKLEYVGDGRSINLIAVSSMYRIHGYERIISGLKDYYAKDRTNKYPIYLHLVGDGDFKSKYEHLTVKYGLEDKVIFHGKKFGKKLHEIYCKSDIAINSLAIHRQGLKTESTLKSKEYAAKGLPIVSSYPIDALSVEGNKQYVLKVPENDEAIDMDLIVDFYNRVYEENREIVRDKIRNDSIKNSDMGVTFKPIIQFYNFSNK